MRVVVALSILLGILLLLASLMPSRPDVPRVTAIRPMTVMTGLI